MLQQYAYANQNSGYIIKLDDTHKNAHASSIKCKKYSQKPNTPLTHDMSILFAITTQKMLKNL